jgi:hypothetical protein
MKTFDTINWHCIALTRQEFESGEMAVLLGAFREVYIARNAPEGMAVFGCWSADGEKYWVYVSPRATPHVRPLLEAYSAKPLERPNLADSSLILGEEASRRARSVGILEA